MDDLKDPQMIKSLWGKAIIVEGYNGDMYRQDFAGAWISREAYGDRESIFGWEIDHVYPKIKGGGDDLINLRPMNWKNNLSKGNDYPEYTAAVTSDGGKNIEKETVCTVNVRLQELLKSLYSK